MVADKKRQKENAELNKGDSRVRKKQNHKVKHKVSQTEEDKERVRVRVLCSMSDLCYMSLPTTPETC